MSSSLFFKRNIGKLIVLVVFTGYILVLISFVWIGKSERLKEPKELKGFVESSETLSDRGRDQNAAAASYLEDIARKDGVIARLQAEVAELHNVNINQVQVHEAEAKAEEVEEVEEVNQWSPARGGVRPGVIILGMHRSGTSIVGGLLSKMGLKTGEGLIHAAFDNEKGFFERVDVVLQNDESMKKQVVSYATNTYKFDALEGLKNILADMKGRHFSEGKRGLKFLNDPKSYPWMLKDPRLCITLRMWLPLLNFVPAILFTYRHPMDVASSMNKRETEHFRMQRALKLWYVYNKRAVLQSSDLCRVTTSHRHVMSQPQIELDRITAELRQCGVAVPRKVTEAEVEEFIDVKLQHGRSSNKDSSCEAINELDPLLLLPPKEQWEPTEPEHIHLYRACMKAYCALEDGSAFKGAFQWDETIDDRP